MDVCVTCEWAKPVAGAECRPCYQYRYRHGVARPEHLIVAHGERLLAGAGR